MRTLIVGTCLALTLALVATAPAEAATVSVTGTGSYEKLVVKNTNKKLIFQIHAPGGRCEIKYLLVTFRDRDGTTYEMDGGCYPGAVWAASLVRGQKLVKCPSREPTTSRRSARRHAAAASGEPARPSGPT